MNQQGLLIAAVVTTTLLAGCGGGSSDSGSEPSAADLTSDRVTIVGAEVIPGDLPASSTSPDAPVVDIPQDTIFDATTNEITTIPFEVESADGLSSLLARVAGANEYFQVNNPASEEIASGSTYKTLITSKLSNGMVFRTSLDIRYNASGSSGGTLVYFDIAMIDASGRVSQTVRIGVNFAPATASPAPSATPLATTTPTPTLAPTLAPTATPTLVATPAPTLAPTPFTTPTASPLPPPTATLLPTATPLPSPTAPPLPTATATPLPTATPTPASVAATECFNPVLYDTGTAQVLNLYERTEDLANGGFLANTDYTEQRDTIGPVIFNGRNAIETHSTFTSNPNKPAERSNFSQVNISIPSITALGNRDGFGNGTSYDPGILLRFDLLPGENYQFSYVASDLIDPTQQASYNVDITYVGRETINIRAGTLETCRYDFLIDLPNGDQILSTSYFSNASGIEVLYTESYSGQPEYSREELIGATVNGNPVH